jgi:1,4-alpha-glucan branching enzyme
MRRVPRKTQVFRLVAPEATRVQLVGDFTQWRGEPIEMTRGEDGVWVGSVGLKPGVYQYRFLVDGEWADDPECGARVPNPYGTENGTRQVG